MRLPLGLAGGAAALQPLVLYFLLPPLLRRQALVALGQGHAARLGGPGSSRCGCSPRGVGAGGGSPRVEFSRFGPTGWRDAGLHLSRLGRDARLHLPGFGVSPRLDLARLATGYDGLSRSRFDRGPNRSSFRRGTGLSRSRLGHRRFEGLRLRRLEPLLRGQLLNLLGHLGGQGHGGLGGQRRAREAPTRLPRRGLDPGNSGGEPGHIFGRRHEVGPVQVDLGHFGIWRQPGWRQALALGQGRRDNLPDISMAVDHPTGRHHIVNPGEVGGVVDDGLVDDRPVDVGDPGDVCRRGAHVIVAGAESPTAEKSRRVIGRGGVSRV